MTALIVLYEDNHLLAVNKPAGLLTQPTDTEQESLESNAKAWIKEKYQKPGNAFATVVHRLDKPTSGIVLVAKTSKSLSRLNEAMRLRQMQKTYYALVEGYLQKKEGTLTHFLKHEEHFSSISSRNDSQAKQAILHYNTLEEFENKTTLVQIVLETGRYHQIRCQFAAIGHPVVGDIRYGAKKAQAFLQQLPLNTIALHHIRLQLSHPVTKEALCLEAPLPPYFRA